MLLKDVSRIRYFVPAFLCLPVLGGLQPMLRAQQALVSCKPVSQKTSETGCWIVASQPLGVLADPVYWTLTAFETKELAERQKGADGTVVEALGKVWLLSVGPKVKSELVGTKVAEIGPLPIKAGQAYTAQYMEATLEPGMVSKTHVHAGVEAFYTESGETCLETPEGKQVGRRGVDIVIPEGVSMELTATGTQLRRGMMLVLHDSSKPSTMLVDSWKSKGLCKASK